MAHHEEPVHGSSRGISRRAFIIQGGALLIAGSHLLSLLSDYLATHFGPTKAK